MKKSLIIRIVATTLFALLLFYIMIPAINLKNPGFWGYLLIVFLFYKTTAIINIKDIFIVNPNKLSVKAFRSYIVVFVIFLIIMGINFMVSPLMDAKGYSKRIVIDDSTSFADDVAEVDYDAIPLLDKSSSQKLGDRVMGQMSELVSQFYVSDLYTQINYNDDIIRVTPLEYASIIKYFTNRDEGVKGYITVNSVTGKTE